MKNPNRFIATKLIKIRNVILNLNVGIENSKNHLHNTNHLIINCGNKSINGEEIKHIASLGTHCLTSMTLKKYGLKRYSLPFDWCFTSPGLIRDCLKDDFKTFLDKSQYFSITDTRTTKEQGSSHRYYEEKYHHGDIFAHRDMLHEDNYRYLMRSVGRFRSLLKSTDGKLFLMISRDHFHLEDYFDELSELLNTLTSNHFLIAIQLKKPTDIENSLTVEKVRSGANSDLYFFTPSSSEKERADFEEIIDESVILSMVMKYKLNLSLSI